MVPEHTLHPERCTAWCSVSSMGIIGSFWIEDDLGKAAMVTAERYRQVLKKFWIALRKNCVDTINEQWI